MSGKPCCGFRGERKRELILNLRFVTFFLILVKKNFRYKLSILEFVNSFHFLYFDELFLLLHFFFLLSRKKVTSRFSGCYHNDIAKLLSS